MFVSGEPLFRLQFFAPHGLRVRQVALLRENAGQGAQRDLSLSMGIPEPLLHGCHVFAADGLQLRVECAYLSGLRLRANQLGKAGEVPYFRPVGYSGRLTAGHALHLHTPAVDGLDVIGHGLFRTA